jgi:hypothetical protein
MTCAERTATDQIDYREGAGSSQGPSSEALASFLSEAWEAPAPTLTGDVRAGSPLRIAEGGQTLSRLMVRIPRESLSHLKVRIGAEEPVPVSFFFGLPSAGTEPLDGGWTSFTNALQKARIDEGAAVGLLATRLPIPLQDGETLELVATGDEPIEIVAGFAVAEKHVAGTHLHPLLLGTGTEDTYNGGRKWAAIRGSCARIPL